MQVIVTGCWDLKKYNTNSIKSAVYKVWCRLMVFFAFVALWSWIRVVASSIESQRALDTWLLVNETWVWKEKLEVWIWNQHLIDSRTVGDYVMVTPAPYHRYVHDHCALSGQFLYRFSVFHFVSSAVGSSKRDLVLLLCRFLRCLFTLFDMNVLVFGVWVFATPPWNRFKKVQYFRKAHWRQRSKLIWHWSECRAHRSSVIWDPKSWQLTKSPGMINPLLSS